MSSTTEIIPENNTATEVVAVEEPKTRGRKPKQKRYFTEETEAAIILYNQTEDIFERNKIYDAFIKYPFDKLVENIIHTFKFYNFDIPYEDVKHEVVAFLNEKMHKFTPGKGKAFSYFSIVAKNYLIINNNSNYHKFKNTEDLEVIDSSRQIINEIQREIIVEEKKEFMDMFVEFVDANLAVIFKNQTDMNIADSVLELFRTRQNIEYYNKKALYIMIRDRTGVKTQLITRVVNMMKKLYGELYISYLKTGSLRLPNTKNKKSEFLD
jgi:hypothetical protein